jgi:hypothetical protein
VQTKDDGTHVILPVAAQLACRTTLDCCDDAPSFRWKRAPRRFERCTTAAIPTRR